MPRRKREAASVSLFPFLSILACVIGVLTLMITALALGQMDPAVIERAVDYEGTKKAAETAREDALPLKVLLQQAEGIRQQLDEARRELDDLQEQRKRALGTNDRLARLAAEADRLRKRIAELEPDLKKLLEEIEQLKQELNRRKAPPKASSVQIQPGGSGLNLKPLFIECSAAGIVIYDSGKEIHVRRADLGSDKQYLAVLDRIAGQENATITFLVRSDAVGTYNLARNVARGRYAKNGKLAVVGQGKIDLSLFK